MSSIDRELADSADGICPVCGRQYALVFLDKNDISPDDRYQWSQGIDGLRPVTRIPYHHYGNRECQGSGMKPQTVILDGE